jgi:gamma-glutamyltranspeptidase/glutathione hydrolase
VGIEVLRRGGNAVDAAVAAAATLNVVEPMMTGVGGDVFALVYMRRSHKLHCLNASGWAPGKASVDEYKRRGYTRMPEEGILSVTVPGAVHGWVSLVENFGTMALSEILKAAIGYAEGGFPVSEVVGKDWQGQVEKLRKYGSRAYLIKNKAPCPGQIFRQKSLARTLEKIGEGGKEIFYRGEIAKAIVVESKKRGGLLEEEDFATYRPKWVEPISTVYRGYRIYECPPNGQGMITLEALNIVEGFAIDKREHNSEEYLHLLIEATKLAFADGNYYISDPDFHPIPVDCLLSKQYADKRRGFIQSQALQAPPYGSFGQDTVYLTVVDQERNVVSFINSLASRFGSGITVKGTGIVLQNRGRNFVLDESHPNCLKSHKRPYHTIIPAMVFFEDRPYISFGVMGGMMQPQGQLQVLCNLIDYSMSPQAALDAPRFRFYEGKRVALEQGIFEEVKDSLIERGHGIVRGERSEFGGGQVILIDPHAQTLIAGSDPRKDGCAQGY